MEKYAVIALSPDPVWLKAVSESGDDSISIGTIHCHEDYLRQLDLLPAPEPSDLLLVDALGQTDIANTVRRLRELGWRFVVVVTAVPSHAVARQIIQAGGCDYLPKFYARTFIKKELERCLNEITHGHQ